ncbi:MAG: glycerol-3-phosphate 1-O-acyltransferase PlsY [Lentisphaerae bacterium]|jgi:glycerol-3-phosphate acyltransferase PlsY|nr:glycerol-3-phosphate 1-O-acyltransferase PlsY [Lentisphaerota bacterium]
MCGVILGVVAYLLGAMPFGLLVARSRGVDIRQQGSGNIGATNVFRVVGKGWGVFTFVLDALKGFIPAFVFWRLAHLGAEWGVLFGILAILGHTFPVFLKFKGGKGVATSAGMLLGVAPVAVGIGFLCWVLCLVFSRIVSLSSILAAVAVAVSVWWMDNGLTVRIALTVLSLLVIWLHRANIKRLMNGTEHRFGKKK